MNYDDIILSSKKTAITRKSPSRPTRLLVEKCLLERGKKILDYGCGKGTDVEYLNKLGFDVYGYDINYFPDKSVLKDSYYDYVICNYVLNVVPLEVRYEILSIIYDALKDGGKAFISVRDISEGEINGYRYEDGVITSKGTFQKLFTPEELEDLVSIYFRRTEIISKRQPLIVMGQKIKFREKIIGIFR